MSTARCVLSTGLVALLSAPSPLQAQERVRLAALLPDLILRSIVLPPPATAELSHVAHFSPIDAAELDNPAVDIVQSFNKLMMMQLSTFPVASSAGGFTYSFDESLGTFVRASRSFGPAFAERALPSGRGRFNAGATYQHTRYSRFEGEPLDNGAIKFYLRHEECCTQGAGGGGGGGGGGSGGGPVTTPNGTRLNPPFEGDLIEAALSLEARTDTVAFFANYGVTNRWDVGFVVPLVQIELDATVNATILRLATATNPTLHTFESGNPAATQEVFQRSGSASGLGDVILRTKYRFMNLAGGGLAAAADVRLPTGAEEDLLGAGGQAKILLVASGGTDRVVGHTNVGYTLVGGNAPGLGLLSALSGPEPLPDEMNYAAGLEVVAHPRLTIIGDLVGRSLRDAGRLAMSRKSVQYQGAAGPQTFQFDEFEPVSGHLNLVLGSAGVKFNPGGEWLISASVLASLTDSGLQGGLTTIIGLDYAF